MVKGKRIREKGKIRLSSYFQKIEDGSLVAVVRDKGLASHFPKRIQGKTGKVMGSRGSYKLVEIKDGNKLKTFIMSPVHLKKI